MSVYAITRKGLSDEKLNLPDALPWALMLVRPRQGLAYLWQPVV